MYSEILISNVVKYMRLSDHPWRIRILVVAAALLLCGTLLNGIFWLQRSLSFGEFIPLKSIRYFRDDNASMTISRIPDATFQLMTREDERVPSSRSVHWLAVDTRLLPLRESPLYLTFSSTDIGRATMWSAGRETGGSLREVQRFGTEVPVDERSVDEPLPVFSLDLWRLDSPLIYISVESQNGVHLRPKVLGKKDLNNEIRWRIWIVAVLAGVLVGSLVNLWVWWRATQDQGFVWLALAAFPLWFSIYFGTGFLYTNPWLANAYWYARIIPINILVFILFSYKTIQYKRTDRMNSGYYIFGKSVKSLSLAFQVIVCLALAFILFGGSPIARERLLLLPFSVFLFVFFWMAIVLERASNSPMDAVAYLCMHMLSAVACGAWIAEIFGWSWLPTELPQITSSLLFVVVCILFFSHSQYRVIRKIRKQKQNESEQKNNLFQYMEQEVIKRTFQIEKEQRAMAQRCAELTKRNTILSHELRSPLSTIIGLARLSIKEYVLPNRVKNDINTIQRLAKQLLQIVDDGLALLRVDSIKTCDLVSPGAVCTKELEQDIQTISEWMSGHHENAFIYSSNISLPAYLRLNEQALRQICTNLITNAGRYCENGIVTVEFYYVEASCESQSHVVLKVSDSGRGIDPAILKELFNTQASTKDSVGLGMGMLIVKQLVDAAQGNIEVSSRMHSGTVVTVTLPATALDIADGQDEDSSLVQLQPYFSMRGAHEQGTPLGQGAIPQLRAEPTRTPETYSQEPVDMLDLLALARTGMYTEIDEVLQDWRVLYAQDTAMLDLTMALEHCLISIDFSGMCALLEDALRQKNGSEGVQQQRLND